MSLAAVIFHYLDLRTGRWKHADLRCPKTGSDTRLALGCFAVRRLLCYNHIPALQGYSSSIVHLKQNKKTFPPTTCSPCLFAAPVWTHHGTARILLSAQEGQVALGAFVGIVSLLSTLERRGRRVKTIDK